MHLRTPGCTQSWVHQHAAIYGQGSQEEREVFALAHISGGLLAPGVSAYHPTTTTTALPVSEEVWVLVKVHSMRSLLRFKSLASLEQDSVL